MPAIDLKFSRDMAIAAVEGYKIATTRDEAKGEPEDTFEIWSTQFRIVDVQPLPLSQIRDQFYRLEGFLYPVGFERFWINTLKKPWSDSEIKYVHFFGRFVE